MSDIKLVKLTKHFGEELETGRAVKRAEVIRLLFTSARKGNVSAQKTLEQITARAAAEDEVLSQPTAEKQPRLGKKEQAQIDAQTAGEDSNWGGDLAFRGALN